MPLWLATAHPYTLVMLGMLLGLALCVVLTVISARHR